MKKSQFLRLADEIEAALNEYLKLKIEASSSQARLQNRRPDSFELRALGTILDDVYHGAESICKRIAEEIDRHVPQGASSHRDLLDQIAKEVPTKRPPVIQLQTKQQLDEYQ